MWLVFKCKAYVLNPLVRDISPEEVHRDLAAGIELRRTKIQLRMHLDRRHNSASINSLSNLTCVSTTDGLDREVAPPLIASRTFTLIDHNHVINNEKYTFSRSGTLQLSSGLITIVAAFNYYALLQ
ncbi:hypothetical protein D910_01358 [Dendroctonus ponderosae]|uniref:Uncharacterized protein n=1 Tax=Dendroctonus ponderosae TaxID=77166 RepID=U4TTE8_DENPD|nr:hypothetical protein D910_01358 [Dendroctonus ponderosae]